MCKIVINKENAQQDNHNVRTQCINKKITRVLKDARTKNMHTR